MCSLEKREQVFVLTLTGDGEHRLDGELIASIRSALARIRSESSSSSSGGGRERGGCGALVTVAEGRFFSNGFDLAWANSAPSPSAARKRLGSLVALFRPVVADLLSLPMPTIAAVTGHAAAAGLMLALSHDYVAMRGDRGFLYMSELDIGLPFPPYFMALMRAKITNPKRERARRHGRDKAVGERERERALYRKERGRERERERRKREEERERKVTCRGKL